ncbi:phosphohistidine phosphatase SixA [soil metagenome]
MELILWRHAEAEDEGAGVNDMQRKLTANGLQQAERMAKWLNKRLPSSTRILVSPAQRTQQTALALGLEFETIPALAPGATVDAVLRSAGWPHSPSTVLVVGHQPTLGLVAARLLAERLDSWAMQKGAVWWLRNRQRDGQMQVVLQAAQTPDCI